MATTRQIALMTGSGEIRLQSEAMPPLTENEVAIRVRASIISPGTEISLVRALRQDPQLDAAPMAFGNACSGEILDIRGDARSLKPGQAVVAMGKTANHASIVHVPINLVAPLPETVAYKHAVYACPGAIAMQAVHRSAPLLGEFGLVAGLGIVGNLFTQLARLSGARVMAWEQLNGRRRIANRCGIEAVLPPSVTTGVSAARQWAEPYGFDFAALAFGGEATECFNKIKPLMKVSPDGRAVGRIALVGDCQVSLTGSAANGNLDILSCSCTRKSPGYHDPLWEHGKDNPNALVPRKTQRNLRECIKLLAEQRLSVRPMTTQEIPLSDVAEAVNLLLTQPDDALGIILEP